jgi:hypothetical protein
MGKKYENPTLTNSKNASELLKRRLQNARRKMVTYLRESA